jgi:hypothetical protein
VQEEEAVRIALAEVPEQTEKLAAGKGLLLDLRFPSFAGGSQNVLASSSDENVKKLQELSPRHDPNGLFKTCRLVVFCSVIYEGCGSVFKHLFATGCGSRTAFPIILCP